jgi:Flp pilus assembly protein CpaB
VEFAQKLLSTRRGTFLVAAIAAILAFSTLLVYLNRYRESLNQAAQPTTVLVAKNLIPRGLSGDVVASQDMFQTRELTKGQLKEGAIGDPAVLKGRVAVADLYPGQQLTVSDFSTTAVPALSASLTGDQRAIAVPLDEAHGAYAQVKTGDYVDVIGAFSVKKGNDTFPVAKTIMDDVLVLSCGPPTSRRRPSRLRRRTVLSGSPSGREREQPRRTSTSSPSRRCSSALRR